MSRFWSIFIARNKEYYRDRASFGWNIMFPLLIIVGFALIFQNGGQRPYKVAILTSDTIHPSIQKQVCAHDLFSCIPFSDKDMALDKLNHHKLEMVMENISHPYQYWINMSSPKGILSESLLTRNTLAKAVLNQRLIKNTIDSKPVYYIEWLFPGIIAMGMMFSSLFGIGFSIVRYRQNGVLKRLKATPLTSFEYLCAQITSRLLMILITNIILYIGCSWLFGFQCKGSLFHLLVFFTIGTISVISLGLIVAARTKTEELAHGMLNMITWPMMFLSEVWFSIEGAPQWIKNFALCLPLSHVTQGLRKIMNDGTHLLDLSWEIFFLSMLTVLFLCVGSILFKWTQ
jgi:ABC transporter DrrB family efflux protein